MIDLVSTLAEAASEVVRRVQRSLVVLHNGRHGIGAGVIWSRDGLILTNNHVVANGRVRAALPDGQELPTQTLARTRKSTWPSCRSKRITCRRPWWLTRGI